MSEGGHKKTFINTIGKKGRGNIKIKIFFFNCFGKILERDGGISPFNSVGQQSGIAFRCLCPVHPVNVLLPVLRNVWGMRVVAVTLVVF